MKDQVLSFDTGDALPIAREYFGRSCGFTPDAPAPLRIQEAAERVLCHGLSGVRLQALVSSFDAFSLKGEQLTLAGVSFSCRAFSQLREAGISRIYAYFITAGEVVCAESSTSDRLFADLWGTAFADAGCLLLSRFLQKDLAQELPGASLSPAFGPGFFGMELTEIGLLFHLLPAEKIGVSLYQGGVMSPEKSCCGFHFATVAGVPLPSADCKSCIGSPGGCICCKNNPRFS